MVYEFKYVSSQSAIQLYYCEKNIMEKMRASCSTQIYLFPVSEKNTLVGITLFEIIKIAVMGLSKHFEVRKASIFILPRLSANGR